MIRLYVNKAQKSVAWTKFGYYDKKQTLICKRSFNLRWKKRRRSVISPSSRQSSVKYRNKTGVLVALIENEFHWSMLYNELVFEVLLSSLLLPDSHNCSHHWQPQRGDRQVTNKRKTLKAHGDCPSFQVCWFWVALALWHQERWLQCSKANEKLKVMLWCRSVTFGKKWDLQRRFI